jgi:hypothetical protein
MDNPTIRAYDPEQDRDACIRVLQEIGWGVGSDADTGTLLDAYVDGAAMLVGVVGGAAESFAKYREGTIRYLDRDLPLAHITGVGTSRVARGQGLAIRGTSQILASAAAEGAAVARLGIFDQGFYDRLGFGSLGYIRSSTVDPAALRAPRCERVPRRLTLDDAEAMQANRLRRLRWHGGCNLHGVGATACELRWVKDWFGLGFEAEDG